MTRGRLMLGVVSCPGDGVARRRAPDELLDEPPVPPPASQRGRVGEGSRGAGKARAQPVAAAGGHAPANVALQVASAGSFFLASMK
jgi:hypothetical protein